MLSFILTFRRMFRGIWRGLKDAEFQVLFSLALLTIISGTLFYSRFEDMRWLDALYFSVVTLTTIGYGISSRRPISVKCSRSATSLLVSASWSASSPKSLTTSSKRDSKRSANETRHRLLEDGGVFR